jgi:hypothetical protein
MLLHRRMLVVGVAFVLPKVSTVEAPDPVVDRFWAGAAMSQTSPGETLDTNSLPKMTSIANIHTQNDRTAATQMFTEVMGI